MIDGFAAYIERLVEASSSTALYQGITVAGEEAEEVRILNNTIVDALQGIHLGHSRRNQPESERLRSTVVSIQGNTVYSRITPTANRDAFGIYVGNCDSLYIENNVLSRQSIRATDHMALDAIYIYGEMGQRVLIRHNETNDVYRLGININIDNADNARGELLWRVTENIAEILTNTERVVLRDNIS
jgi:hypothetical protein